MSSIAINIDVISLKIRTLPSDIHHIQDENDSQRYLSLLTNSAEQVKCTKATCILGNL